MLVVILVVMWVVGRKTFNPEPATALKTPELKTKTFDRLLARWQATHGEVCNLLPSYTKNAYALFNLTVDFDIADYSFDQAVITDNAEIAAMLVANNFHFENNCAVLSVDGFPGPQAETIMTMLRRNPNLTVVAVHDASKRGVQLAQTLRNNHWFPDHSVNIIDVGLYPRHARELWAPVVKETAVPARKWTLDARLAAAGARQPPCAVDSATLPLRPEEQDWLDLGNVIELAAVRPAQLMRVLFNAFAYVRIGVDVENHAWIYDYRDDYAADHFG